MVLALGVFPLVTPLLALAVDKYIAMAKEKHGYNIEQVGWGS